MKKLLLCFITLCSVSAFAEEIYGARCDVQLAFSTNPAIGATTFSQAATKQAKQKIKALGYKIKDIYRDSNSVGKTEFVLHFGAQDYRRVDHVQAYFIRTQTETGDVTYENVSFLNGQYRLEETGKRNKLLREFTELVPACKPTLNFQ